MVDRIRSYVPSMPEPGITVELEANIVEAVRASKRHRESAFRQLTQEHRPHPTFQPISDPVRREIGFKCSCTGGEQEFRITIRQVKELVPSARQAFMRMWEATRKSGNKAKKRNIRKAKVKAHALLHKYLTKEQKWDLRGRGGFFTKGSDGHTYEIRDHQNNNVTRWENGEKVYKFCVVTQTVLIPVHDLMLAQKVMIETNTREFLDIAVTSDLRTEDWWSNGRHIDNPDVPVPESKNKFRNEVAAILEERTAHEDLERQQHDAEVQAVENATRVRWDPAGQLLMHDMNMNPAGAMYEDIDNRGFGFVMNANYEVVPCFDTPIVLPPLPSEGEGSRDVVECMIRLITEVPATSYKSVAEVQAHFRTVDLVGVRILMNPETDAEWSARGMPPWHSQPRLLGALKILDDRVPKGKAWYLADGEYVGICAHWYDEPKIGYCIHNLNGVAIYEPSNDQDQAQAEEIHGIQETRHIIEEERQEAEARDEIAERILVRTGG